METVQIVLTSLTLVASCASPLVIAFAYLISHVRKSQCCGSYVEIVQDEHEVKKTDKSKLLDKDVKE